MIEVTTSVVSSITSQDGPQELYIAWAAAGAALVLVMLGIIYGCRKMICIRPPPFDPPKLPEDTNDRCTPFVEHGVVE
ncbi:hypothetical protein PRIPAC_73240 [Pristionchus pacificus]|uniref:Uncharacterized protein n=1 Tax=Pristionchus pacificus TaxID=54126 RepID=A0A2A6C8M2_PRIPA|nr:hypothetical protein PRIPAC_73240 [Pristionchus pacificus]|eukprot:PDM74509.1 hypothetical protein PRIPAC_41865 [Pristionchus pacificus]